MPLAMPLMCLLSNIICVCYIQNQWTPLHVATKHGHDLILESLIKRGSDVNAVTMVSCFVLMISYLYHYVFITF